MSCSGEGRGASGTWEFSSGRRAQYVPLMMVGGGRTSADSGMMSSCRARGGVRDVRRDGQGSMLRGIGQWYSTVAVLLALPCSMQQPARPRIDMAWPHERLVLASFVQTWQNLMQGKLSHHTILPLGTTLHLAQGSGQGFCVGFKRYTQQPRGMAYLSLDFGLRLYNYGDVSIWSIVIIPRLYNYGDVLR